MCLFNTHFDFSSETTGQISMKLRQKCICLVVMLEHHGHSISQTPQKLLLDGTVKKDSITMMH